MRHLPGIVALACMLSLFGTHLAHATVTQLPELIREPARLRVTFPDGRTADLEALITRPAGPGRFPLVMINHGFPRDVMKVATMTPEIYSSPSIVFARHGYAAVVVNRRGFGLSTGPADMASNPCNGRNYLREGRVSAEDIDAALTVLRREPWVDPDRIILLGHSAGGLGVLAAAAGPLPGVVGILDFAGGRGSSRPDFVCNRDGLVGTMHTFGTQTHIPGLWVFSANDHFFGPALAQQMFAAYAGGGAPAEFFAAPAFSHDGHRLVLATRWELWWPRVAAFLDGLHLPTQTVVESPPPPDLAAPPGLDAHDRAEFFSYLGSRAYEKAYATDGKGHVSRVFSKRTREDAAADALVYCTQQGWACTVYAVGNTLVEPPGNAKP
jgi:dienelactone hydrolase